MRIHDLIEREPSRNGCLEPTLAKVLISGLDGFTVRFGIHAVLPIIEKWREICDDPSPEALMFPTFGRKNGRDDRW